jgi:non-specific serine/threonine protein kinase
VISRTSVLQFKSPNRNLKGIARELDVRYVLEGSVRRAGNDLRVTAQLIDAETDSHLWAKRYSGTMQDVFAVQEEIARKIVSALEVKLTRFEDRELADRPFEDPVAYDCYLRARQAAYEFTPDSLNAAGQFVDEAMRVVGDNPLLLVTKGMICWNYVNGCVRPDANYLQQASDYAQRALDRNPEYYLGIFLRGLVAARRGAVGPALRDMRAAYEQKPGDATILLELCRQLFSAGHEHSELGELALHEMFKVDPLHPIWYWGPAAFSHFTAGRALEAERAALRMVELSSPDHWARMWAAWVFALLDRRQKAVALLDDLAPRLAGTYGSMAEFFRRALCGDRAAAITSVTRDLEKAAALVEYPAIVMAQGYSLIGETEVAFSWLRRAVSAGFVNYRFLSLLDPLLEPSRQHPDFGELMQEVRPQWAQLESIVK